MNFTYEISTNTLLQTLLQVAFKGCMQTRIIARLIRHTVVS